MFYEDNRDSLITLEVAGSNPAPATKTRNLPENSLSVASWAALWLSTLLLKPKTRGMYSSALRAQILPEFGERALSEITRLDIQTWVARLTSEASPSHVRNCVSILRRMMDEAIRHGFLQHNPVEAIALPKRVYKDKRPLTMEEVRGVAATMGRYESFVLTLATLGVRWAEAVGLREEDVHDGYVTIGSSLTEVRGKFTRVPTKNYKSRRLPIPDVLVPHLHPPFATYYGNPIRNSGFREKIWYPALEKAGVRKVNVHSLRATCASELVRNGASVVLVSKWLGHSDPKVTLSRYSFLFDRELEEIAKMM